MRLMCKSLRSERKETKYPTQCYRKRKVLCQLWFANTRKQSTLQLRKYPHRYSITCGTSLPNGATVVNGRRRKQYPRNWEQLARQCKEQAGKRCRFCHITQGKKRKSKRTGQWYHVHLHAAHRDHDIGNPNPHLLCLCPTCHGT